MLAEFRSSITGLGSQLAGQLSALEKLAKDSQRNPPVCKGLVGYEKALKKLGIDIRKDLDEKHESTAKSIEQTQELLFNIGRQLEDTHLVMTSLSKDMNRLNERQFALEKEIKDCEAALRSGGPDCSPVTSAIDDGSTLLNDGPITRSMSKRRPKSITVKKVVKPRDTAVTRTIIPWEEVEMCYDSEI